MNSKVNLPNVSARESKTENLTEYYLSGNTHPHANLSEVAKEIVKNAPKSSGYERGSIYKQVIPTDFISEKQMRCHIEMEKKDSLATVEPIVTINDSLERSLEPDESRQLRDYIIKLLKEDVGR